MDIEVYTEWKDWAIPLRFEWGGNIFDGFITIHIGPVYIDILLGGRKVDLTKWAREDED